MKEANAHIFLAQRAGEHPSSFLAEDGELSTSTDGCCSPHSACSAEPGDTGDNLGSCHCMVQGIFQPQSDCEMAKAATALAAQQRGDLKASLHGMATALPFHQHLRPTHVPTHGCQTNIKPSGIAEDGRSPGSELCCQGTTPSCVTVGPAHAKATCSTVCPIPARHAWPLSHLSMPELLQDWSRRGFGRRTPFP